MITSIAQGIYAVGHIDYAVRDFHGYETERGTTYNSYLLQFDKTAVIDGVKAPFAADWLATLQQQTSLAKIDYVVVNHAEPDHSGALPALVSAAPQATVVCNKKTQDFLTGYYDTSAWKFQVVKTGDTLELSSGKTLRFIEMPLVHWPDSMASYLVEEQILFCNDAFGEHYASNLRFDDENPLATLLAEAKSYYANIVNPYSKRVAAVLAQLSALPLAMICPSHGVIWRKNVPEILGAYQNWANQRMQPKVLVLFDSMWGRTATMAQAVMEGVSQVPGVACKIMPARAITENALATETLDAAAVALGSSTLNQQMMPMMAARLCYLQGLNFPARAAFAFGSHGWGKGGPELLDAKIDELKWTRVCPPVLAKFEPTPDALEQCRQAGKALAEKALEIAAASGYQRTRID
ncbi:MAG: FprA family A-type flavoprotein [Victivallales bacterium]|nr:FprA family A-type flavoprotein [Victivallales bacterium]